MVVVVEEADRWAQVLVYVWWSLLLSSLVVVVASRWALALVVEVAGKWELVWVLASLLLLKLCWQSQMVQSAWGNRNHNHAPQRDGGARRDAAPVTPATDERHQLRPKPTCKWQRQC